jgi:hypothetical protein
MSLNRFFISELFPIPCVPVPWRFYFFVSIASSSGNYFTLLKSAIFNLLFALSRSPLQSCPANGERMSGNGRIPPHESHAAGTRKAAGRLEVVGRVHEYAFPAVPEARHQPPLRTDRLRIPADERARN